jgi:hypothetical protein
LDKRWRGVLGFTLFLMIALVGRNFFDGELAQDLWVLGSGLMGLALAIAISHIVTYWRKRRVRTPGH